MPTSIPKSIIESVSIDECIQDPLRIINSLFEANYATSRAKGDSGFGIPQAFDTLFNSEDKVLQIPSLNDPIYSRSLPPAMSLVRFRCMVQDTGLGQELFINTREVTNPDTGDKTMKFFRFTDFNIDVDASDDETLNSYVSSSSRPDFSDRQSYYCVSIPGESTWVTSAQSLEHVVNSSFPAKKYPFPDEPHVGCIVKVYGANGNNDVLKVTEVCEFIGILVSSNESHTANDTQEDTMFFTSPSRTFTGVPVLHAITHRHLPTSYPNNFPEHALTTAQTDVEFIRAQVVDYLALGLGGDKLAAEFVLLQLFSRTFSRTPTFLLGPLTLNLTNFPSSPRSQPPSQALQHINTHANTLTTLLSNLLPRVHALPLTLKTLNGTHFNPRSVDEDLLSGILQVPEGTLLVVDETVLEEGTLEESGVKNIQTLNTVLRIQELTYTFPYSSFNLETDVGAIVLSAAKSMLSTDCVVRVEGLFEDEQQDLTISQGRLEIFRAWLGWWKFVSGWDVKGDVAEYIQDQFVESRKTSATNQEELMLRMTLARLVALSFGRTSLTPELWDYTVNLDEKRKARSNAEETSERGMEAGKVV